MTKPDDDDDETGFETSAELRREEYPPVEAEPRLPPRPRHMEAPPDRRRTLFWVGVVALIVLAVLIIYFLAR